MFKTTVEPKNVSIILPIGAELSPDGQTTRFRVWAPERTRVAVVFEDDRVRVALQAETGGYFSAEVPDVGAGATYKFALDDDQDPYPDPASRFQPRGPHHFSQVVDHRSFSWTDADWPGVSCRGR
jgi:maltooligosyltrehalose trehalohydrolase